MGKQAMGRQDGPRIQALRVVAGSEAIPALVADLKRDFARAGRAAPAKPSPQREAFSDHETGQARARGATMSDPIQGDQLKTIVQRIERLEEEKRAIADDVKEVYGEAKANGYDVKILRKVIALRKRDLRERREEEAVLELYLEAVGETA